MKTSIVKKSYEKVMAMPRPKHRKPWKQHRFFRWLLKTISWFDLKATNGQVIATSQVYSSSATCKKGIASVQKNAPVAGVENQTVEGYAAEKHPKFEVYADKAGEYRYRLFATNGESIAISEEGYKSKNGCIIGIKSVAVNAVNPEIVDESI